VGHRTDGDDTGEGQATVFIAIDHCSAECVEIHAHPQATRFRALEPIRQGVRQHFGGFAGRSPTVWPCRMTMDRKYMSHHFQTESTFRGIESGCAQGIGT